MTEGFGVDYNADYTTDKLPVFPDELQGNSAEGHVIEQGMMGYGKHAVLTRENVADPSQGGADVPGAFIQGNNAYNSYGAPHSGNTEFDSEENMKV